MKYSGEQDTITNIKLLKIMLFQYDNTKHVWMFGISYFFSLANQQLNGDNENIVLIQLWLLLLLLSWCLMSSDVIWHIRDKFWPMPKHGSIRKVYACLAVTCHLHFWQNDRDFLRATVVTRGWNGYRNKSQHRKSTLEKKILPPFQQGFEPATFQSRVQCSNHWAIPAPP